MVANHYTVPYIYACTGILIDIYTENICGAIVLYIRVCARRGAHKPIHTITTPIASALKKYYI
jgi:hypothetical protein